MISDEKIRRKIIRKKYTFSNYITRDGNFPVNLILALVLTIPFGLSHGIYHFFDINGITVIISLFLTLFFCVVLFMSSSVSIIDSDSDKPKPNKITHFFLPITYLFFNFVQIFIPSFYIFSILTLFIFSSLINYHFDYIVAKSDEVEKYEIRDWKLNRINKKNKRKIKKWN